MSDNQIGENFKKMQKILGIQTIGDNDIEEINKNAFRKWMSEQVKPEGDSDAGEPYSNDSINSYVSNIANTECPSEPSKSLFYTTDKDIVALCVNQLENAEKKNNTQRSAVKKYFQFVSGSVSTTIVYETGLTSKFEHNRIIFGAPGTGKSFMLNEERKELLGENNETGYERVTFHPDYSYANFVGTYKPVMVSNRKVSADKDTDYVISILNDNGKTAQEKYDVLFEKFKDDGLTRLPVLLGLYTDEMFKTRKQDGTDAAGDNSVERNHGKAIRKYVSLLTGQETSSDIAYEYVPGPFMRVYVNALKSARTANPKPYLLIIEEINRANVAAVFGDVFQLLDRDENGVSEYPIQASEDIKKYLAKELGGVPDDYSKIKIPDNMFIWATMNSADQGVFPMDTAFKRRWDFTYIGIDDNDEDIRGKYVTVGSSEGYSQRVEWNELRKSINKFMNKLNINEDKQLGPYFLSRNIVVPENGDEIDAEKFAKAFKNKVIMYLFEDAAKQRKQSMFEGCWEKHNIYSEICKAFDDQGVGIFNHDISIASGAVDLTQNGVPVQIAEGNKA